MRVTEPGRETLFSPFLSSEKCATALAAYSIPLEETLVGIAESLP